MSIKKLNLLLLSILLLLIIACDSKQSPPNNRIVIGMSADVQSFNSLFAFSYEESTIADLLYPGLLDFKWNEEKGELDPYPMIAKSWQWAEDSSFIKFTLMDDILWSDGKKLTASDIVFSYDVFSDPDVQSRLYGIFNQLFTESDGHVNIEKTFNIISPYEFEMYFPENSIPDLVKIIVPVIPEHVFKNVSRDQLANHESNFNPVSSGAFKLKKWERNQSIILEADSSSFLFKQGQVSEMIFKIVPDYTSRMLQVKKGEIDLVELVKVEDVLELKKEEHLVVFPLFGREYDYIGWNNIDPESISGGQVKQNKFFGSINVRKALSFAINKKEILEEYLQGLGELAASSVSPIFISSYNNEVKPYEYNPDEAKRLLALEGWKDEDRNGILEKGKEEFKFKMYYPVGNPLREYAAVVVKNNLKSVGIEVTTEKMELGTFIDNLYERKLNSWMAGWGIPIPLDLKPYWYSDQNVAVLNFQSYNNSEVDKILDRLEDKLSNEKKYELIKEFQKIIHQDEPVTFLYWTPNIIVYNTKIKNLKITPYGVLVHCWEWTLN
ncbi:MAG: ABC transporter substrate-binding protein [Ignavibacteriaceae bacterium]|nr:ABC transporter substrate-binding protein [Ignavibacteriaceae bacterium]